MIIKSHGTSFLMICGPVGWNLVYKVPVFKSFTNPSFQNSYIIVKKVKERKKVLGSTVVKGSLSIFNPPHPHPNPYPPLFCFKDGAFESLWVLTLCVCFLQWTVAVIQTRDPTPHRPVSTTPWSTAAWLPKRYFIILFILVSQNFF